MRRKLPSVLEKNDHTFQGLDRAEGTAVLVGVPECPSRHTSVSGPRPGYQPAWLLGREHVGSLTSVLHGTPLGTGPPDPASTEEQAEC